MKKIEQGFSLIELLVVVAIIGILAAVGTVGYGNYIKGTKEKVLKANAEQVAQALRTAKLSQGAVTIAAAIAEINASDIKNPYTNPQAGNGDLAALSTDCSAAALGKIFVDDLTTPTKVKYCKANTDGTTVVAAPEEIAI